MSRNRKVGNNEHSFYLHSLISSSLLHSDESSLRLDWEAVPSVNVSQPELSESNLIPAVAQQSTIATATNRITSILHYWIK